LEYIILHIFDTMFWNIYGSTNVPSTYPIGLQVNNPCMDFQEDIMHSTIIAYFKFITRHEGGRDRMVVW
jgi:hypothetical protein